MSHQGGQSVYTRRLTIRWRLDTRAKALAIFTIGVSVIFSGCDRPDEKGSPNNLVSETAATRMTDWRDLRHRHDRKPNMDGRKLEIQF